MEGFFRSAEIEYWACIVFMHGVLHLANEDTTNVNFSTAMSTAELGYIQALYACCLLNIAVVRVHQPKYRKLTKSSLTAGSSPETTVVSDDCAKLISQLNSVSDTMAMSPLELCDFSLSLNDDKIGHIRKFLVLEKLKR